MFLSKICFTFIVSIPFLVLLLLRVDFTGGRFFLVVGDVTMVTKCYFRYFEKDK